MGGRVKSLAKDTAIYGISNMLGRFLNWALFPLYVYKLPSPEDYGIVTNLYAWTGIALIFLTYGMETGFFRFINKEPNPNLVYANTLRTLGFSSGAFVVLGLLFLKPISAALGYPQMSHLVAMLIVIAAIDAFSSIPFAYLRHTNKAFLFAAIKLGYILLAVLLNLFFLVLAPMIAQHAPASWIGGWYREDFGVGYIFLSNLIANVVLLLALLPHTKAAKGAWSFSLLKRMLSYSWPILVMGIAGVFNQMADKVIFPLIFEDQAWARHELGVYSAGYKIAIVIVMFTQAFRFAYEPFIFKKNRDSDHQDRQTYALVMRYYIMVSLFIFLAVMAYLDVFKILIKPNYYEGLRVVPIVMAAEIFFGIYYNLALWYKLTDRTYWGGILSFVGCVITVLVIVWGAPKFSYMANAWAGVISFGVMMVLSYCIGRKYYPVPYHLCNALFYTLLTVVLTAVLMIGRGYIDSVWWRLAGNTVLVGIFVWVVYRQEPPLREAAVSLWRKVTSKVMRK